MTDKLNIELGAVQETLVIPLYGRAEETKRNGILTDTKAVEIIDKLAYDFSSMKGKPTPRITCLRTLTYDSLLKDLLKKYPSATVVELGCGLNTRKERIGDESLHWYYLDMPDVYELWKKFFEESPHCQFLPYSAFDPTWVEQVKKESQPPYIFISEASTIYFTKEENRKLFELIAEHFPGSYYIFDTITEYNRQRQSKSNDTAKMFSARVSFCMNDVREIEQWGEQFQLIKEANFMTHPPEEVKKKIPLLYKLALKVYGWNKERANQYQINVFKMGK